jgi:hypothetical protein
MLATWAATNDQTATEQNTAVTTDAPKRD